MEFHVIWHRCAEPSPCDGASTTLAWSEQLALPWEIDFETAVERLAQLERMFIEPDGSFVWRPVTHAQIDGVLYDRGGRLLHVELKGRADWTDIASLQATLNPSSGPIAVQLVREGTVVRWENWRCIH
jgi:hypothetical protein